MGGFLHPQPPPHRTYIDEEGAPEPVSNVISANFKIAI
ncbi:hypothetical protein OP10G_1155 [Fimbriimonas ginsengisoli Gsoil 348]|uniref:Uncharacterized protein n=1 Tax=Fimbriimonas ginsengisoli Gsoil 348 TaxID=661478 RepID=A0A068NLV0_FIMGI|nr:hypothetical protein OP10G_1155 [Fimbriimonas ginsengisoli Gsoil 348]